MKTPTILVVVVLALCPSLLLAAESERTAEALLTTPAEFEGKQVTLDVGFVRPVRWKSPVEEFAFFHAVTMDRNDHKAGGEILVAITAAEAAEFTKKYGTDYEGRYDKDVLAGTFIASPGRNAREQFWLVDTTGKLAEIIAQKKISLQDDSGRASGGTGDERRKRWER
jgi:hypothetical protein